MILDRGRTVDWFSSEFIIWLSILSATSLILFIIVELFAEHPIVNLRALKNFSFSLGNVIMFFVVFNLYGSIVLLPIYLQTLMGYTATLAGIVLAPGAYCRPHSHAHSRSACQQVKPEGNNCLRCCNAVLFNPAYVDVQSHGGL
jgi:DHA2 family multidrug resistance protein